MPRSFNDTDDMTRWMNGSCSDSLDFGSLTSDDSKDRSEFSVRDSLEALEVWLRNHHHPLRRPYQGLYFLGGRDGIGGVALDSHDDFFGRKNL